jgi:alanine racemase
LIDPHAVAHNLDVARACAPSSKIWAVVKANAYGHGIDRVYPALSGEISGERDANLVRASSPIGARPLDGNVHTIQHHGADGIALLDFDEAVRVRELGWTGPILLLEGFFEPSDLPVVSAYGLTAAVQCDEQLAMLESFNPPVPLPIYLKMNSGMNRLGFRPDRYKHAWERARGIAAVGDITLMTHFAQADGRQGVSTQYAAFEAGTEGIPGSRCLSNSAATLWHPSVHGDWLRPGVMLYGGSPSGLSIDIGTRLLPAMTLQSRLIGTQQLQRGDAIGYGAAFIADRPMKIGVVACGYADGYPRTAPAGTPIVVDGHTTCVVGRVSMDMITVDLTPCPHAGVGTPVELWGNQLPIDDVAAACGTIGYELMTAIAARVPKVSVDAASAAGAMAHPRA